MSRPAPARRALALLLLGALALGLAGCGDNERLSYAAETDEPAYREGAALLKTGRKQEALNAFLKVIVKRGDDSAESHLEVGLLYLSEINDPLSAIYHFRKYLALRPNSPQAPLVRQRIDAATREFARTLPAQPLETQLQRVDLVATLDRLNKENEALKQELADVKASRGPAATPAPGETDAATSAGGFKISTESIPVVRTRPAPPAVPVRAVAAPPVRPAPAPVAPAPAAGRTHVVQPGDTLSKLAQKYYNNRARWHEIYAANRNVMKNEADLHVGTELKIP
jgi:tetratricopeptide (TPR) repeat protein